MFSVRARGNRAPASSPDRTGVCGSRRWNCSACAECARRSWCPAHRATGAGRQTPTDESPRARCAAAGAARPASRAACAAVRATGSSPGRRRGRHRIASRPASSAFSKPLNIGVSTEPIGPGYTQPYACPPTVWYRAVVHARAATDAAQHLLHVAAEEIRAVAVHPARRPCAPARRGRSHRAGQCGNQLEIACPVAERGRAG